MPDEPRLQHAALKPEQRVHPFPGFEPLTANFIYCPNQFFDVCLPNSSRGVVRLVAYMLHRTLGWLDRDGNPIRQQIDVSYQELVDRAGISRGAARKAIDEAVAAGFITRTRKGRAKASGESGETSQFTLRWDHGDRYLKNPDSFNGFFAGEGHRSPIPTAFFEHVLPHERLAVIKAVGTVLRHTVGYQNQFGGRRSQAALSYSYIQRYANLKHRPTLAAALRHAVAAGYIHRVTPGTFDPDGANRQPATYAVRWLEQAPSEPIGPKSEPALQDGFKIRTSNGSKTEPADRAKNRTIQITRKRNENDKQQPGSLPSAAAENQKAFLLLRKTGFDDQTARTLSRKRGLKEIQCQIHWIDARNPRDNRLGMLRRAIEDNWPKPPAVQHHENKGRIRQRETRHDAAWADQSKRAAEQQRQRIQQRDEMLSHWRRLSPSERKRHHAAAIEKAPSDLQRRRLRCHTDLDEPPTETLLMMAGSRAPAAGDSS